MTGVRTCIYYLNGTFTVQNYANELLKSHVTRYAADTGDYYILLHDVSRSQFVENTVET